MKNESKFRLLSILEILTEDSDKDNQLTTQQIITKLAKEYNIPAHRTTVGNDIDILIQFGYDICRIESTSNKYYLASRKFEPAEVKMLIYAVAASKFISEERSDELISKLLEGLASKKERMAIKKHLISEGKAEVKNDLLFESVDVINDAINKGNKISFKCFKFDEHKQIVLKNQGRPYVFSPYSLVWNGEFFYTVGYSDKHEQIVSIRVDRLAEAPLSLKDSSVPKPDGFDLEKMIKAGFNMYANTAEDVILECSADAMDSIIERFGVDVQTNVMGVNRVRVKAHVPVDKVFFSWIFGFAGKVEIISPTSVKNKYRDMVLDVAKNFE